MEAVLRTYRVRVDPRKVGAYESFERQEGLPMVRSMPGCLAAGFGKVEEADGRDGAVTYLFWSLWRTREELELARKSATWKAVAGRLEAEGMSLGGDVGEHVRLSALSGIRA